MKESWHIEVEQDNPFSTQGSWFVSEGNIADLATILSICRPGKRVTVTARARTRLIVLDGKTIFDQPSLRHWYSGVDDQNEWEWYRMYPLTEPDDHKQPANNAKAEPAKLMWTITEWAATDIDDDPVDSSMMPVFIIGKCPNRPGFEEGISTTRIVKIDGNVVTTASGSQYMLAAAHPEYVKLCEVKGWYVPTTAAPLWTPPSSGGKMIVACVIKAMDDAARLHRNRVEYAKSLGVSVDSLDD